MTHTEPEALIHRFLQSMQSRDLEGAQACLHKDFEMVFPGATTMHRLDELIQWASSRYRSIAKQIDSTETCKRDDSTIVWCYGTLYGEWPDGSSFENIRFVDRFEVTGGLIRRQAVWNDLAEVRASAAR